MFNEKILRLSVFIITAALHIVVIFFFAFNFNTASRSSGFAGNTDSARVMKLTDFAVTLPAPAAVPRQSTPDIPEVESIAENMIETDTPPLQNVVAAGSLQASGSSDGTAGDYLPMHLVSQLPRFSEDELIRRIVYPPIAQRSELEGMVYLEIFVDPEGVVRSVTILKEDPPGRGFGEAAVKAFMGFKGIPAMANGVAVAVRYRYPVRFSLK